MFKSIKNRLFRRSNNYRQTFNGPCGKAVLADLKKFCHAVTPTADIHNPNATYVAEGRREVWLRIQAHLNLSDEDVYNLVEELNDE